MALTRHNQEILKQLASLPDSAVVPLPVAAIHEGISVKQIRRTYPRVKMTDRREGVQVSYLRRPREQITA